MPKLIPKQNPPEHQMRAATCINNASPHIAGFVCAPSDIIMDVRQHILATRCGRFNNAVGGIFSGAKLPSRTSASPQTRYEKFMNVMDHPERFDDGTTWLTGMC